MRLRVDTKTAVTMKAVNVTMEVVTVTARRFTSEVAMPVERLIFPTKRFRRFL